MNKKIIGALCCIVCIILAIGVCLNINRNKKYNYDSLQTFINDVSDNKLGENITRDEPKFVAYKDDGEYCIDVLQDLSINQDIVFDNVVIELNGHSLTFEKNASLTLNDSEIVLGNINILTSGNNDDRVYLSLNGSRLSSISFYIIGDGGKSRVLRTSGVTELSNCIFSGYGDVDELRFVTTEELSSTTVSNCSFVVDFKECTRFYAIEGNGELNVDCSTFDIKNNSSLLDKVYSGGILQYSNVLRVSGCTIKVENYAQYGISRGIAIGKDTKTATINDSNIYADSHYLRLNDSYGSFSQGIMSSGLDITVKGCVVRGVHSGMQVGGGCYIENSHFESTGHGGIYFVRSGRKDEDGADIPATYIVKDSDICWCEPSGIFKGDIGREDCSGDNEAAFYVGGSDYASNITVYMVGCTVYGKRYSGVLRGTSNERQNTLYISYTTMDKPMRIDKQTLEMYVGKGCNISMNSEIYWKKKLTKYSEADGIEVFFDETVDYSKLF